MGKRKAAKRNKARQRLVLVPQKEFYFEPGSNRKQEESQD